MKVTMVNPERLPVPPVLGGGVEQVLFETALSIREPELTVVSPWAEALSGSKVSPADIFYHVDVDAQAARVRDVLGSRMPSAFRKSKVARRFYYLNGVTDLLPDLDPDIIEVHNRPEFVPYLLKQFPQKRAILYMHNEPDYSDIRVDKAIRGVDHLVSVSRYLARRFISRYPECASKVTVIHNGVDTDVWHPGLKEDIETENIRRKYGLFPGRTVLFVGRIVPEKGIHCLLEAMDIVRRRLSGAKLMVVGSPFFGAVSSDPFLKRLKRRASQMGDAVVFTGYVDRTPHFFAAADVTVTPSIFRDPFPKAVLESAATGVPVIGSRRGGIPEIIDDGINGALVDDPGDVRLLARHITDLLEDSGRREKMGAAARQKAVGHFSMPIRLSRLQAFYRFFEGHFF